MMDKKMLTANLHSVGRILLVFCVLYPIDIYLLFPVLEYFGGEKVENSILLWFSSVFFTTSYGAVLV